MTTTGKATTTEVRHGAASTESDERLTSAELTERWTATAAAVLEALLPPRDAADGAAPKPGAGAPNAVEADAWVSALVATRNSLDALLAQAMQVARDAGVEDRFRSGSDARYLKRRHHLSDHDTKQLLGAVRFTGTSRGVDGDIRRCLPETFSAFTRGRIGAAHVAAIADALDRIPETRSEEIAEMFERALVQYSRNVTPHEVKNEADAFLDVIGAGHVSDRDRCKRRGLFLGRQHTDGMSYLHGWLTPQARAWFETMTTVLGQPGLNNVDDMYSPRGTVGGDPAAPGASPEPDPAPAGTGATEPPTSDSVAAEPPTMDPAAPNAPTTDPAAPDVPASGEAPESPGGRAGADASASGNRAAEPPSRHGVDPDEVAAAAERDERTNSQRTHDAFAAACEYAASTGALGSTFRGLPAHLVLTVTLDELETACGHALTATGTRMSITEMLTCAERIHPALAIFDHTGHPLFLGRSKRTASLAQRLALFARDRGCTRPGCDHGAFGAEVHHLIAWAAGGLTDVPNLAIACKRDHRHITDTATGLTAWMGPDGRPVWAARSPDPQRPEQASPGVNTRHRPGEELARLVADHAAATATPPTRAPEPAGAGLRKPPVRRKQSKRRSPAPRAPRTGAGSGRLNRESVPRLYPGGA